MATLIAGWGGILATIEVVAGTGGVFDIHVDDELVFHKKMIGRYPEPEDVLPILRHRLGPEPMPG